MGTNNSGLVLVASTVCMLLLGVAIWFTMSMTYTNQAIGLENQAKAQQEVNKTVYDTVWKTIKQRAQVSEKYESQFKNVYTNIMQERHYDKGGDMFKFVAERNPQFDSTLLQDLGNTIEGQRVRFETSQKMLLDIKREHDNLRQRIPSSWFVGTRPELKIDIVTSEKTQSTFATKKEDNVDVFGGK